MQPKQIVKHTLCMMYCCFQNVAFSFFLVEVEQFTDVYHAKFRKIEHARRAKKFFDARNFYGGIIHISYAPEFEANDDIRRKFSQRKKEVQYRLKVNSKQNESEKSEECEQNAKIMKLDL